MRTEYENMVKEFLPALRASSARMMAEQYKISQEKIAELLETTQAAVSKYLNGKYSDKVKELEKTLNQNQVSEFVKTILDEKKYDAQRVVCSMCAKNLSFKCSLMIK